MVPEPWSHRVMSTITDHADYVIPNYNQGQVMKSHDICPSQWADLCQY